MRSSSNSEGGFAPLHRCAGKAGARTAITSHELFLRQAPSSGPPDHDRTLATGSRSARSTASKLSPTAALIFGMDSAASGEASPMGSATTRLAGKCIAWPYARACASNAGATMATEGIPRSSNSAASRTLRDVHDPQDPSATTAASTSATRRSKTSAGSGWFTPLPSSILSTGTASMP